MGKKKTEISLSMIRKYLLYLQCNEYCADMDGEVKDSNDHTDDQVRLQTLILCIQ